jgi:hypothetical protein
MKSASFKIGNSSTWGDIVEVEIDRLGVLQWRRRRNLTEAHRPPLAMPAK